MNTVIQISLIGAGLVILGLMLLWFMMELLVRLTTGKVTEISANNTPSSVSQLDPLSKHKAAAAATAVSMVLLKSSFLKSESQIDQRLTAWQSINRQKQIQNRPDTVKNIRKDK